MPNINIRNTKPNTTAKNTVVAIGLRNAIPHIAVKSDIVHNRISSMGSVTTTISGGIVFGGKGYLIGMLGLTYTKSYATPLITNTVVSDFKPNIRIRNE